MSLSTIALASPCRDDLPRHSHAPFSIGDSTAASPSSISPSNGLNAFVTAPLADPPPDALVLPLCPVCGIASSKSCFDCEQQFCANHIYSCADCANQYCGNCLDAHHADGHWADSDTALELASAQSAVRASPAHWSDSDTAFELAASRGVVRASSVNSPDLLRSEPAVSQRAGRSSSASGTAASQRVLRSLSVDLRHSRLAGGNQHRQASWFAILVKLKSLLSQHVTRVATLIRVMFQNVALQSEAGS